MGEVYFLKTPRKVFPSANGNQAMITLPRELAEKLVGKYVVLKIKVLDTEIT